MEQKLGSCKKKKQNPKQAVTPYEADQISVYNTPVCLLKPEKQDIHKKKKNKLKYMVFFPNISNCWFDFESQSC